MTTGDAPYGQFLVEIICKAVLGEPPLASCRQYNLNILPISSRFSTVEPVPLVKPPALIFAVPHNTPPAFIRARQRNHFWFRIRSHTIFHPPVYCLENIITIHKHTIQPSSLKIISFVDSLFVGLKHLI